MPALDLELRWSYDNATEIRFYVRPLQFELQSLAFQSVSPQFTLGTLDIPNNVYPTVAAAYAQLGAAVVADQLAKLNLTFGSGYFTAGTVSAPNMINELKGLIDAKAALKVKKIETFQGTSDANGDITINTSVSFTNPRALVTPRGAAGAESFQAYVTNVSGTAITLRLFKNKQTNLLVLGNVDPDAVVSGGNVDIVVFEPA